MHPNVIRFQRVRPNQYLLVEETELPVGHYDDFLDQLSQRLGREGFTVIRGVVSGDDHFDLIAFREDARPGRIKVTRFIIASHLDPVNAKTIKDYSSHAFKFIMNSTQGKVMNPNEPTGRGIFMIVPVVVSDDATEELKAWMYKMPEVHFYGTLEFPVLVSPRLRRIYYSMNAPPIGWEYYNRLVEFVEKEIGFH